MEITPLIPQGYNGPIHRLKCSICQHIFYITQADYEAKGELVYCHECSIMLHAELEKMQPIKSPAREEEKPETAHPSVRHPRTIEREKMTTEQLIEEGKQYIQASHHEEALASFTQALQKAPKDKNILYEMAKSLERLSRFDEALSLYDEIIHLAPIFSSYSAKAFLLEEMGRVEDALATYDQCIEHHPTEFQAYYWKGALLSQEKRHAEALTVFEYYLALDPTQVKAMFWKGSLLGTSEN